LEVPFLDLGRELAALRGELEAAMERVLDSGRFLLGEETSAFEEEFAAAMGAEHAVGVASGTDAVELGLRAVGVEPGDEVVTQANTCVPTVTGIVAAGATPVLCDADPVSGVMDLESLESALGERTRAVVPVHLYGQCADTEAIAALCEPRGIAVVEDCAQAHGASLRGRPAGTIGAAGAFSFYPTKNLGAIGDGGAVVTEDAELADRLRLLRHYGQADRYRHECYGVNSRLDEIQAAILRVKLPHLPEWAERRRAIAATYTAALRDGPVEPLAELPGREHAFHLYVVRADDRDGLQEALAERGVATLIHYPIPIHRQTPFVALANGPVPLRGAEELCESVLSLPLFPGLTAEEVALVAEAAAEAAATQPAGASSKPK
jgi:dTDP-3-amino-3,4,6-trideoxy-alpha-D-glucose transaminase